MVDKEILEALEIELNQWRRINQKEKIAYTRGAVTAMEMAVKMTKDIMKKAGKKID